MDNKRSVNNTGKKEQKAHVISHKRQLAQESEEHLSHKEARKHPGGG